MMRFNDSQVTTEDTLRRVGLLGSYRLIDEEYPKLQASDFTSSHLFS